MGAIRRFPENGSPERFSISTLSAARLVGKTVKSIGADET